MKSKTKTFDCVEMMHKGLALLCGTVYLQSHVYVSQKDEAMNERIQIHPQVCHGKPVIRETRVLVSTILGALAGGDSIEEIVEDYPNITKDDVRAALDFGVAFGGHPGIGRTRRGEVVGL